MGSCAPQLINEQVLLLEHHHMEDSGMKKMLSQYNTRVVKELDVADNKLTHLSLRSFPQVKWSSLTFLNFNKNKLGDKGCKYLSMATLNRLQRLVLSQNNIGNAGVLHLSKAVWKSLKYLGLSFNRIQHQGAQHLSKAKWENIQRIQAYKNKIDDAFHFTSTIILVTSHQQEQIRLQKQREKMVEAHNGGLLMSNGLLLQLY